MNTQQIIIDRPLLKVGCTLGEGVPFAPYGSPSARAAHTETTLGPIYDPRNGVLHFVDIQEKKVNSHMETTFDITLMLSACRSIISTHKTTS